MMPIILLLAAVGLFVGYTNGEYQEAKALAAERDAYDSTLNTSKERRKQRDDLVAKRNTFTQDNLTKLTRLLPDNVDNIRLIIDINNIAARHKLTLKNVALGELSAGASPRAQTAVGSSGEPIGSVDLAFTVSAGFENFIAFLVDIEHSLRLVDVQKISFKTTADGTMDYSVSIRTYWLR